MSFKDTIIKNIGITLNEYYQRCGYIDRIKQYKFKEEYQGNIIDLLLKRVDDNYIETPPTNGLNEITLVYSHDGIVRVLSIKGKTIVDDRNGNETSSHNIYSTLKSVGQDEDNKIILTTSSANEDIDETNTVEIVLNHPLRGINSEIYDEINGMNLIQRVGRIRLKDMENWEIYNRLQKTIVFSCSNELSKNAKDYCNGLCDKIPYEDSYEDKPHIKFENNGTMLVYVGRSYLTSIDLDGFNAWLEKYDPVVVYELAEPIVYENYFVNKINLKGYPNTVIRIENKIVPSCIFGYDAQMAYRAMMANQQNEIDMVSSDLDNNIIPYLMDMEFNLLMLDEELTNKELESENEGDENIDE